MRLAGIEVAQPLPITWQQQINDGPNKAFLPIKRISETSQLIDGVSRMSLSKVPASSSVRFSDAEDKSISAIPDAGNESQFGPFIDSELGNVSIYELQKQIDGLN